MHIKSVWVTEHAVDGPGALAGAGARQEAGRQAAGGGRGAGRGGTAAGAAERTAGGRGLLRKTQIDTVRP